MIPKVLTALISAAILSAVLGAMPCEATDAKHRSQVRVTSPSMPSTLGNDLNRPATDFSSVTPVLDSTPPDRIAPRKDRNEFFDQKMR